VAHMADRDGVKIVAGIDEKMKSMNLDDIYDAVVEGDAPGVEIDVRLTLESGIDPEIILKDSLIPAMGEVGILFEEGQVFVPELMVAARAMKAGVAVLRPRLVSNGAKLAGKVLLGTVKGDLHDVGKNLVGLMFEGVGFEVIDIGIGAGPDAFAEAIKRDEPQVVGMSALLTTTMMNFKVVIDTLERAGVRDKVKVLVGGAPVTQAYADSVGADG